MCELSEGRYIFSKSKYSIAISVSLGTIYQGKALDSYVIVVM